MVSVADGQDSPDHHTLAPYDAAVTIHVSTAVINAFGAVPLCTEFGHRKC